MFCPNCGNNVNSDNFCPNCGVELYYGNNYVVIKEHYLEVKGVHDDIDTFIKECDTGLTTIKGYVDNDDFISEFVNNPSQQDEFIASINYAENSLINFRETILETLDDDYRIEYLRSMNYIFGDVDNKINKCLSLIEDYLNYIDTFRNKIEYYDTKFENDDGNTITVEEFHLQIDEIIKNINNVYILFTNQLKNQEIYEELRNDTTQRESLKNNIIESFESFKTFDEILDENLEPSKLSQLKQFDNQYGDIEKKLRLCATKIEETKKLLNKCLDIIDDIENPKEEKNIKLNKKRIVDL